MIPGFDDTADTLENILKQVHPSGGGYEVIFSQSTYAFIADIAKFFRRLDEDPLAALAEHNVASRGNLAVEMSNMLAKHLQVEPSENQLNEFIDRVEDEDSIPDTVISELMERAETLSKQYEPSAFSTVTKEGVINHQALLTLLFSKGVLTREEWEAHRMKTSAQVDQEYAKILNESE